jgi:sec-independent protein translocase protein TatB
VLGLSPVRLLIIAAVGLILVGPNKLPEYARQAGAAWRSLRNVQRRVEDELRGAVPDLPRSADLARYARSPISLLNQLADRAEAEDRAKERAERGEDPAATAAAAEGYRLPADDPPEVRDPERPPLSWGDPSLN